MKPRKNELVAATVEVFDAAGLESRVEVNKHVKIRAGNLCAVVSATPSDSRRGKLNARAVARRLVSGRMTGDMPTPAQHKARKEEREKSRAAQLVEEERRRKEREKRERRERNATTRAALIEEKRRKELERQAVVVERPAPAPVIKREPQKPKDYGAIKARRDRLREREVMETNGAAIYAVLVADWEKFMRGIDGIRAAAHAMLRKLKDGKDYTPKECVDLCNEDARAVLRLGVDRIDPVEKQRYYSFFKLVMLSLDEELKPYLMPMDQFVGLQWEFSDISYEARRFEDKLDGWWAAQQVARMNIGTDSD